MDAHRSGSFTENVFATLLEAAAVAASIAGCTTTTMGPVVHEDVPTTPAGADASAPAPAKPTTRFEDLVPGQVNILKPGGDTVCSRGTEYAFVVVPGDRDKVIVEFEGGGACWDEQTCGFADAIFKEKVDPARYTEGKKSGFYDRSRPENPMKSWTHVYIPYCTGDVHWGDSVKTYGSGESAFTIHHKGGVNVKAALEWTYAQIASPKKIFVTGCSAGGYGSIWWAPQVQKHYPDTRVYHFSDSAAGVITEDFFQKSFPAWNAAATFPSFLGDAKAASSLPLLYGLVAAYYPNDVFSQFNTRYDENQTFYFSAMGGGDKEAWSSAMKANLKQIMSAAPNFRAFLAEGEKHCILPYDEFYTVDAGGKKLTEWLSDMVNDRPVETVACSGCAP